jgi:hypothetical protein
MNGTHRSRLEMSCIAAELLALLLSAISSQAQQKIPIVKTIAGCRVTNLGPTFIAFWEHHAAQNNQDQARDFEIEVVNSFEAVYDGVWSGVPSTISHQDLLMRSFKQIPLYMDDIRVMSASIDSTLPMHIASFQRAFPDFDCSIPVYFLYSAGAFDGAVRKVDGKSALMFGLDEIARIYGQEASPLFSHELFHVYHQQVVKVQSDALYWSLWEEGLATYVSRSLNPGLPDDKICCLPDVKAVQRVLPSIAAELLLKLDSTSPSDQARYFIGMQQNLDLPQRSGYYVGYLIARELGKDKTLAELARLQPDAVRMLEEESLQKMRSASQKR